LGGLSHLLIDVFDGSTINRRRTCSWLAKGLPYGSAVQETSAKNRGDDGSH